MDSVSDALFDGRHFPTLTLVDNFTRECLAIEVAQSVRGEAFTSVLKRIDVTRGLPRRIQVDNDPSLFDKMSRYCWNRFLWFVFPLAVPF